MRQTIVTMPDIMLIAGTRVALGAGIGLLLAGRLRDGVREGAGWALLVLGALTTIPLVIKLRTASQPGDLVAGQPWAGRHTGAAEPIHSPP